MSTNSGSFDSPQHRKPRHRKPRQRSVLVAIIITVASTVAMVLGTALPAQAVILPGEHGFEDCSGIFSGEDGTGVFNFADVAADEGDNIFDTESHNFAGVMEVERVNIRCVVVNNGTGPVNFRMDIQLNDAEGVECETGATEQAVGAGTQASLVLDQPLHCADTLSFDLDRWDA